MAPHLRWVWNCDTSSSLLIRGIVFKPTFIGFKYVDVATPPLTGSGLSSLCRSISQGSAYKYWQNKFPLQQCCCNKTGSSNRYSLSRLWRGNYKYPLIRSTERVCVSNIWGIVHIFIIVMRSTYIPLLCYISLYKNKNENFCIKYADVVNKI